MIALAKFKMLKLVGEGVLRDNHAAEESNPPVSQVQQMAGDLIHSLAGIHFDARDIYFDDIPGVNDVEKLQKLPDVIEKQVINFGTRYSQDGGYLT